MIKPVFILLALFLLVSACSNDDAEAKKAHVWKQQTDTLDKAKAVEGELQDSADAERKKIEEETR